MLDAPRLLRADLAPGDERALALDWTGLRLERIGSAEDPLFARAYARLWQEFGARGEMERQSVIADRFAWAAGVPVAGHALRYEMLAVLAGEALVAVRDHTAIVPPRGDDAPPAVVVHLSHVVVEPPLRGRGLSGWLRALPLQAARACAAAAGVAAERITLVAEMEADDTPDGVARLRSYARAGFRLVDPAAVRYWQPDFRPPAAIDAVGPQPVPLALVVRRVGRESETTIGGAEVRTLVTALYTMFGAHVRAADMAPLWASLQRLPAAADTIALLHPLEARIHARGER